MSRPFHFKQFSIVQEKSAMKVGTDGVLLGAIADVTNKSQILDIGAGTGLLTLMIAQRSQATIDAVEIDKTASEEALYNINQTEWKDRIQLYNASFQHFAKSINKQYDAIVCNPPYFSNSKKAPDKRRSMARHNDFLSLHDLLLYAQKLMFPMGNFTTIVPIEEKENLLKIAEDVKLYPCLILNIKPTPHKPTIRSIVEFTKFKRPCFETHLMIHNDSVKEYTDEYKEIMRDFYLAF